MGYCIYTGASAVLEDARNSEQGAAHPVLRTFIRALQSGISRCPLLERSLDIIIRSLSHGIQPQKISVPANMNDPSNGGAAMSACTGGVPVNPYIPAFPYMDPEIHLDFGMNQGLSDNIMNPMALLDCFPEMQLDTEDFSIPL